MSRKVFDYAGISTIEIKGPQSLLERIADNMEGETDYSSNPNCIINLNQSKNPVKIEKDKRFPYLTIDQYGSAEQPSIKYTRYDTPVRIIHRKSSGDYEVDINVAMDESSGLICVRNHLSNHPELLEHILLHAALLNVNGRGILIPGNSKQGKTTLAVYLLQEYGASFVSDENVFLDTNQEIIKGLYVPRTPRVRFSTIAQSKLSKVLRNIEIANATQYIDPEAVEKIINTRSFDVDAGLSFSRRAFCDLLGTKSQESSPINMVLFPKYEKNGELNVRKLGLEEGVQRLSKAGLIRKSDIDPKELQETTVNLKPYKFEGSDFIEVEFSGLENLKQGGFKL